MPDRKFTFEQGLQMFFIRRIVTDYTGLSDIVGTEDADLFFTQWSKIIRENPGIDKTINIAPDGQKQLAEPKIGYPQLDEVLERASGKEPLRKPPDVPAPYLKLIQNPRFKKFFPLLNNPDLGELMQIEFKPILARETRKDKIIIEKTEDPQIIRRKIAFELEKDIDELTEDDFKKVTELDLSNLEISNINLLKGLTNLRDFSLSRTQVSDIDALKGLSNLRHLDLSETQVSNIDALKGLTNLKRLYITDCKNIPQQQINELKKVYPKLQIVR
jgi:hypothetical protein